MASINQRILQMTTILNESRSQGGAGLRDLFPGAPTVAWQYTVDLANWDTEFPWVSVADADTASTQTLDGGAGSGFEAFEYAVYAESPEQAADVQDALERFLKLHSQTWDKIRGDRDEVATYEAFYVASFQTTFFQQAPGGGGAAPSRRAAGGVPPNGSVGFDQLDGALRQFADDAFVDVGGATGLTGRFIRRDGSHVDDPREIGLSDMLDALRAEGGEIGIRPTLAGNTLTLSWVDSGGTKHLAVSLGQGGGSSSHTDAAITALAGALMGGSARYNWDPGTATLTDVATGTALIADGSVTRAKLDQDFLATLDAKSNILDGSEDWNGLATSGVHYQAAAGQAANAPFGGPLTLMVQETSVTQGQTTSYGLLQFAKQWETGNIAFRQTQGLRTRPTAITADWTEYHPRAHFPDTDAAVASVTLEALEDSPAGYRPNPVPMTMALDSSSQYLSAAPNVRGVLRVANDTRAWPAGYLHGVSPERGALYIEIQDSAFTGGWGLPSNAYYRRVGTGDPYEVLPISILWDGVNTLLLKSNAALTTGQIAELQGRIELYIDYREFRTGNIIVLPGHHTPERIGLSKFQFAMRNGRPAYTLPADVETAIANRLRGFADLSSSDKVERGDLADGQQLPAAPADGQIPKWNAAASAWLAAADEVGSGGGGGGGGLMASALRAFALAATRDADAKAGIIDVLDEAAYTGSLLNSAALLFARGAIANDQVADDTLTAAKLAAALYARILPNPAEDSAAMRAAFRAALAAEMHAAVADAERFYYDDLRGLPQGVVFPDATEVPEPPAADQHINLLNEDVVPAWGVMRAGQFPVAGGNAIGFHATSTTADDSLTPHETGNGAGIDGIAAYPDDAAVRPAAFRNRVGISLNGANGRTLVGVDIAEGLGPFTAHTATQAAGQTHDYWLDGTTASTFVAGRFYRVKFRYQNNAVEFPARTYEVSRYIFDAMTLQWVNQGKPHSLETLDERYVRFGGTRPLADVQIRRWTGTQAEYDAIARKDDDTLYLIQGTGIALTGAQITALLEALTGAARLDASASLRNYPEPRYVQVAQSVLNRSRPASVSQASSTTITISGRNLGATGTAGMLLFQAGPTRRAMAFVVVDGQSVRVPITGHGTIDAFSIESDISGNRIIIRSHGQGNYALYNGTYTLQVLRIPS